MVFRSLIFLALIACFPVAAWGQCVPGTGTGVCVGQNSPTLTGTVTVPDSTTNSSSGWSSLHLQGSTSGTASLSAPAVAGSNAYSEPVLPAGQSSAPLPAVMQGVTITVCASGCNYTTIVAALNAVSNDVFTSNVGSIIQLGDGVYPQPVGGLTLSYDFGRSIFIQGQHTYPSTISGSLTCTGSAGAWSCPVTVSSATGVAAGDVMVIYGASGGANPDYLDGAWVVSSVAGTTVTLTVTSQNATPPSGSISANETDLKSIVTCTGSINCIQVWNGSTTANVTNLAIQGDGSSGQNCISVDDGTRLYNGGVLALVGCGAAGIVSMKSAHVNGGTGAVLAASTNGTGVNTITNSVIDAPGGGNQIVISTGNTGNGVVVDNSRLNMGTASDVIAANGNDGVIAADGGFVNAASIKFDGNAGWGMLCQVGGFLNNTSATGGNNGTGDLSCPTNTLGNLNVASGYGIQFNGGTVFAYPDGDLTSLAVGRSALTAQTSSSNGNNFAFGNGACQFVSSGISETCIGAFAGQGVSGTPLTGNNNGAIGNDAGQNLQGAATVNWLEGNGAGKAISTGAGWTCIGMFACEGNYGTSPITSNYGVAIGYESLLSMQNGVSQEVSIGDFSSSALTTAVGVTSIGHSANQACTTGCGRDVIIGDGVASSTSCGTQCVLIGTSSNCEPSGSGVANELDLCESSGSTPLVRGNLSSSAGSAYFGVNARVGFGNYTVSTLPTPSGAGWMAEVTDANAACSLGTAPVGGGATNCTVVYNGAAWKELGI